MKSSVMLNGNFKTGNLNYIRAVYNRECINSLNTIYDYVVEDEYKGIDEVFTDIIRIEKDNGYHARSRDFDYWLIFRDMTNWKKCTKTGLAKTFVRNGVYVGDISIDMGLMEKDSKGKNLKNPKHFFILSVDIITKNIILDVFKDFYPRDKNRVNAILKEHKFYKLTKKECG